LLRTPPTTECVATFYLDNDVSADLITLLARDLHTVITTRQLGLTTNNDAAQLLAAVQHQATLVTHNRRDFVLVHKAWHGLASYWGHAERHPGILILPQGDPSQLHQCITAFLGSGLPLENQCYEFRHASGWRATR
jgi:hypothetical protein